jgi:hypothetical protein
MDAEMAAAEMARVEMAREVVAAAMAGAATVMAAAAMAAAAMAMAAVAAMAQERPSASAFRSLQVLEQLAAVWTGQAGAAQVHEVMASTPLVAVLRLIAHIIVLVTSRSLQQFRAEMAPSRDYRVHKKDVTCEMPRVVRHDPARGSSVAGLLEVRPIWTDTALSKRIERAVSITVP